MHAQHKIASEETTGASHRLLHLIQGALPARSLYPALPYPPSSRGPTVEKTWTAVVPDQDRFQNRCSTQVTMVHHTVQTTCVTSWPTILRSAALHTPPHHSIPASLDPMPYYCYAPAHQSCGCRWCSWKTVKRSNTGDSRTLSTMRLASYRCARS